MAKDRNSSPLFTLVAIITIVATLYLAKAILLPVALAILLSFLLTPVANRLESWGLPRILSVMGVAGMSFVLLIGLGWIVTNQFFDMNRELPAHKDKLIAKIKSIKPSDETFGEMTEALKEVGEEISGENEKNSVKNGAQDGAPPRTTPDPKRDTANQPYYWLPLLRPEVPPAEGEAMTANDEAIEVKVVEMPPSPLTQVKGWFGPVVAPLTTAGMVVVLVFFILLDRENQRNRLVQLFGTSKLHRTTEAFRDVAERVGRYLRMQFLINAGYGVAVTCGLALLGVPAAILWGVLGFLLRFLPYIGPWLAAALPILVSVATSDGWTQPLLVFGMYVVYELVLNNVAEPLLYGNSIGVSTVGVILAAIFWTWIWGPIGLILAMPMTVCLVVTARYVPQLRFLTVLLADQPPLTPSERIYQRLLAFDYTEPLKVAQSHLKSEPLVKFYDDVLIPALALAEQDRHAGLLNEDQEEFVHDATQDLIEELADTATTADSDKERSTVRGLTGSDHQAAALHNARVLCIALRDEADEAAARMLAQLLTQEGFEVEAEGAESLTSEMVDRVATSASDLVVISILPPIAPRDSRLLWKRLRTRYPDLPIIVGFWNSDGRKQSLVPPENDHATKVATSLAEAVTLVRTTAAQVRLVNNQPPLGSQLRDAAG